MSVFGSQSSTRSANAIRRLDTFDRPVDLDIAARTDTEPRPTVMETYPLSVPSDTFRHRASTPLDVDEVWAQLQQPEKWKAMGGIEEIHDPRIERDLLKGFAFTSRIAGTAYRGLATTTETVDQQKMVVDIDTSELKAVLTVELSPIDASTQLDVTMRLSSKSFLTSMMWGLVASTVGSGLPQRIAQMIDSFD
jgi:hypothetical protein